MRVCGARVQEPAARHPRLDHVASNMPTATIELWMAEEESNVAVTQAP